MANGVNSLTSISSLDFRVCSIPFKQANGLQWPEATWTHSSQSPWPKIITKEPLVLHCPYLVALANRPSPVTTGRKNLHAIVNRRLCVTRTRFVVPFRNDRQYPGFHAACRRLRLAVSGMFARLLLRTIASLYHSCFPSGWEEKYGMRLVVRFTFHGVDCGLVAYATNQACIVLSLGQ